MKTFFQWLFWFVLAMVVLFLAIVLGELGAWYFAWVIGTVMIILLAAAGTVMLDSWPEKEQDNQSS